jgi:hypothetical protein
LSDNNKADSFIFEESRNKRINAAAALRIVVPTLSGHDRPISVEVGKEE